MKKASYWAAAAACAVLTGCVTAPVEHDITKTHTFTESKDVIWERAVNFFAERNLSIKTIEKASGIIAADRQITAPSTPDIEGFADCGAAPITRNAAQTIDLNLFVRTLPDGKTSVTVNTHFTVTRMLGYNAATALTTACTSTGKLEGAILDSLGHLI